jgi:hypothetical protein
MLDHIVARCIEREARNRFESVSALADALAALVASEALAVPAPRTQFTAEFSAPFSMSASPGEDPTALTNEVTRIDVRRLDSSEPVLDARGPRYRSAAAGSSMPGALPQLYAGPGQIPRALGSNHGLHRPGSLASSSMRLGSPRGAWGEIDRGSYARMEVGWQSPVPGQIAQRDLGAPVRAGTYPARGYDMAAASNQDAWVRRIIWIALVVIAAVIGLVIAAR